jgi:hypothetical protein
VWPDALRHQDVLSCTADRRGRLRQPVQRPPLTARPRGQGRRGGQGGGALGGGHRRARALRQRQVHLQRAVPGRRGRRQRLREPGARRGARAAPAAARQGRAFIAFAAKANMHCLRESVPTVRRGRRALPLCDESALDASWFILVHGMSRAGKEQVRGRARRACKHAASGAPAAGVSRRARSLTGGRGSAQARLGRFQGASAISSADYYGDGEARPGGGGGGGSGGVGGGGGGSSDFDMSANDLMNKLTFQARTRAARRRSLSHGGAHRACARMPAPALRASSVRGDGRGEGRKSHVVSVRSTWL